MRIFPLSLTLLSLLAFPLAPLQAQDAPASAASRAQAVLNGSLERIVTISADGEEGVWALTDAGRLYHCVRLNKADNDQVHCVGRDGPVKSDY
ncbi:hypothetical protein [Motiliproteus sp. SC1-56]|uniref:hypothetical protein n=1 Tax=Motiliproteus sp. SC1-56 TaxID=2799565 RepID=UPI001A8CBE75|nr:hypothetical protein [Motiliproteus sp. SC1-56]